MLKPNQRRLYRALDEKDFLENRPLNFDLSLGYDVNAVIVKLKGTVTVGTAPTAYHEYGVPRLLSRLDLLSNGKNKYMEATGLKAALANFERQLARQLTDITTGTGAKSIECHFRLDLENADGPRPKDSSLHTVSPFMTKFQLQVLCGAMTDMVKTAGSFAVSSFDLQVEVGVEETIEYNDAAYFENRLVKVSSFIEETIDATKSNHRVKLATGELMTRGVVIIAKDENGALSNAVVNSIQLKSGVDVPALRDSDSVRAMNIMHYKLADSQLPTGMYYIDLCPDGNLNQLWDTRGRSELDLVLDVTKPGGGDATLEIFPVQFYEQENSAIRERLGIGA